MFDVADVEFDVNVMINGECCPGSQTSRVGYVLGIAIDRHICHVLILQL